MFNFQTAREPREVLKFAYEVCPGVAYYKHGYFLAPRTNYVYGEYKQKAKKVKRNYYYIFGLWPEPLREVCISPQGHSYYKTKHFQCK
jgi:hypothetical protein